MDRLTALRVFAAVVEAGGFTAAARAMEMSPAGVTGYVQALERHLKTRLLHRTTRRVSLTDEGAAYYDHVSQILARIEQAEAMLSARRASPKGLLRVSMPVMLGTLVVLPSLPAFLEKYPDLRIEVSFNPQAPAFGAQDLEMALQVGPVAPGLTFRPLGLSRVCTLATPEYLSHRGCPVTPDDLEKHDVIGMRTETTMRLFFERDGRVVTRVPAARISAGSGDAQLAIGLAHGGIFQAAQYAVGHLLESGRLVRVLRDWEWSGAPFGAVLPPNRFSLPKVAVFLQHVQQLLEGRIAPYRMDRAPQREHAVHPSACVGSHDER